MSRSQLHLESRLHNRTRCELTVLGVGHHRGAPLRRACTRDDPVREGHAAIELLKLLRNRHVSRRFRIVPVHPGSKRRLGEDVGARMWARGYGREDVGTRRWECDSLPAGFEPAICTLAAAAHTLAITCGITHSPAIRSGSIPADAPSRFAVHVEQVRLGPCVEKQPHRRHVAASGGVNQRRDAE